MRNPLVIAAVLAFAASGAFAQTQTPLSQTQTPPAKDGPQNSAINTPSSTNRQVDAPVAGRNSFTEGEAKARMEKLGFTNITELKKDENGVWRGRAMKDGKAVAVSLDYQGNVVLGTGTGTTGIPVTGAAGR